MLLLQQLQLPLLAVQAPACEGGWDRLLGEIADMLGAC